MPRWTGESTATWVGETLVVHTSNFCPEGSWGLYRYSDALRVEERFTLVSANEILYEYKAEDSGIYTRSFTVQTTLRRRPRSEPIYEYACHEGNHSLAAILRGARLTDTGHNGTKLAES